MTMQEITRVTTSPRLSGLSVFFPAHNEAENLPLLIADAERLLPRFADKFEVVVVDDGSLDETQLVMRRLMKTRPWLRLVTHERNLGYGAAVKTGINASRLDWIFFTDGDRQFDLAELDRLTQYVPTYEVVIGWRAKRADPAHRRLNARLFKLYIDLLFRLHVRDIDCAFKLFKRELIQSIVLESSGAFTTSELLYKLKKKGVKFKEVAVSHYPRQFGNQTGARLGVIIKAGWEALALYLAIKLGRLKAHRW